MSIDPGKQRYLMQPRQGIVQTEVGVFVTLTRGYSAQIDEEDIPKVSGYLWSAMVTKNSVYAGRRESRKWVLLHRSLMNAAPGVDIDHRNGNTMDCRKANLRYATRSQNTHNSVVVTGEVPMRGVWMHKKTGRYRSQIMKDGQRITVGTFATAEEAAAAYEATRRRLIGEFYPER